MSGCLSACSRANAFEDMEDPPFDLYVLEAKEFSLTLAFRSISSGSSGSSSSSSYWRPFQSSSKETLSYTISVLGGPHCDIYGPREEHIRAAVGTRVWHEVLGLQPDTEYSISVSLVTADGRKRSETIEVRTANATTAQFAGEDWHRLGKGHQDSKHKDEKEKQPEIWSENAAPPGRSNPLSDAQDISAFRLPPTTAPPGQEQPGTGDDASTIAPSDAGSEELEGVWPEDLPLRAPPPRTDSEDSQGSLSSAAARAASIAAGGQQEVIVEEVEELEDAAVAEESANAGASRRIQCNLLSLMDFRDCLKLSRSSDDGAQEIVVEETRNVPAPEAAAPQRRFRPYRAPFPGIAINPALVGLELLEVHNMSEHQAACDRVMRLGVE